MLLEEVRLQLAGLTQNPPGQNPAFLVKARLPPPRPRMIEKYR
jgi:hypothetical protein